FSGGPFRIPEKTLIGDGKLPKEKSIPRIQLRSALQLAQPCLVLSLSSQDKPGQGVDLRVVVQTAARDFQLRQSALVVAQSIVKVSGSGEVCLGSIGPQASDALQCSFRLGQAFRSPITYDRIEAVVSCKKLTVGFEKSGIARDCT